METAHTCEADYTTAGDIDTTCPACVHDHAVTLVEEEAFDTYAEAVEAISDFEECHDCSELVAWSEDRGDWVHVSAGAADCFLVRS